jgi:hypothetical protein
VDSYRNVGTHPECLDDGGVVGEGEFIDLTVDQQKKPEASRLIKEGVLIKVPSSKESGKEGGN